MAAQKQDDQHERTVTGKLSKIPKWDFIFARVKTGQVGT